MARSTATSKSRKPTTRTSKTSPRSRKSHVKVVPEDHDYILAAAEKINGSSSRPHQGVFIPMEQKLNHVLFNETPGVIVNFICGNELIRREYNEQVTTNHYLTDLDVVIMATPESESQACYVFVSDVEARELHERLK